MQKYLSKIIIFFAAMMLTLSSPVYAEEITPSKYKILIDTNEFTLYVIDSKTSEVVKRYPVALGKKETPSPIGCWKISSKALKNHVFGGYWLGLNVPWDTFGIHGTNRPDSIGSLSSNGCIRMYNYNIEELFSMIDYDTPVVVYSGPSWIFSSYARNIKPNDKGADVYEVQRILNALGYYNGPLNGIYDYPLMKSVQRYKMDYGFDEENYILDMKFLNSIGIYKFE